MVVAALQYVALMFALALSSILRQAKFILLVAALFLELNMDRVRSLMARGNVDPNSVSSRLVVGRQKQVAELPLEGFVEVEVDEWVVDVGTLGEDGGENKTLRSHVLVLLVENEKEGHDSVGGPGDYETQTDAEEHLEAEVTEEGR